MQVPRLLSRVAARSVIRRNAHYDAPAKLTTYNDLPSPAGSWQTNYDAKQRRYTGHLLLGVGTLTGTIIFGKAMGFLDFHDDIPERPATIESYK